MSTTICGHDRERLIFVLQRSDVCPGECDWKMIKVVYDPAKLSAIIEELLRGHGFRSIALPWTNSDSEPLSIRVSWACPDDVDAHGQTLLMPQARAFALRLLETPTATAQDVERMIGDQYALG